MVEPVYDDEKAQKQRHQTWKGNSHQVGVKSKMSQAEKMQNKLHVKGLDTIAKKEAIKQQKIFVCPFCGDEFDDEERVIRCISTYHSEQLKYATKLFRNTPLLNDINLSLPIYNVLTFHLIKHPDPSDDYFEIEEVFSFLTEKAAENFIIQYDREHAPNYSTLYPRDLRKEI